MRSSAPGPRKGRVIHLLVISLVGVALSSCNVGSLLVGTTIDERIKMFNKDLASYNWSDLVNQFSPQNKLIASNQLNSQTAATFFSNYPFAQKDNPTNPGQIVVQSEDTSTGKVTASYTNEVGGSYTLDIVMVTDSSKLNWYILSITFVGTAYPAIQHIAPTPRTRLLLPKAIE